MSKVTIEIELSKLSSRGHEAFRVLMQEISKTHTQAAPSVTIELLAEKLYKRMARKPSMRGILDAIIDSKDGSLTFEETCKASGHPAGKAQLAGVLSSMTRNWKRYTSIGKKPFLSWEESEQGTGSYHISDAGLLEPLRNARDKFINQGA